MWFAMKHVTTFKTDKYGAYIADKLHKCIFFKKLWIVLNFREVYSQGCINKYVDWNNCLYAE